MGANSGPTSSGAMTNFMVALTSSLTKLVNTTIKFVGLHTRSHGKFAPNFTVHAALASFFYGTVFKPVTESLIYLGGS